jgi:hypothetical protein
VADLRFDVRVAVVSGDFGTATEGAGSDGHVTRICAKYRSSCLPSARRVRPRVSMNSRSSRVGLEATLARLDIYIEACESVAAQDFAGFLVG